jgi:hypothetical protein
VANKWSKTSLYRRTAWGGGGAFDTTAGTNGVWALQAGHSPVGRAWVGNLKDHMVRAGPLLACLLSGRCGEALRRWQQCGEEATGDLQRVGTRERATRPQSTCAIGSGVAQDSWWWRALARSRARSGSDWGKDPLTGGPRRERSIAGGWVASRTRGRLAKAIRSGGFITWFSTLSLHQM